ncbi:hypothetical protein [uncultured Gimesia sp.]|uniref:hypothetical protein n=1 Tax=uncultured Gimesia sp. TaxID=1678688 RepID=UPI0030D90D84|tara:strand:+ start:36005 stop:36460 length:456 start_codon:yes stop_codon:yes gene_type:complete
MKQIVLLAAILFCWTTAFSAEPAPEEDYQILEGKWVRNDKARNGAPLRVEQEFSGKVTKLHLYDSNGTLIHAHQAKYRLQRMSDANLFTYYDLEVLTGPNKGKIQKAPRSFIYRVKGNQFIQVEGILNDDKTPLLMTVWWKVKPPVPQPDI